MRRAILAALMLAAGALGVALLVAQPAPEREFFAPPPTGTWVIAHRGGAALRPENTLAAFEHAAAIGADVLEMDLRATSDGEIVVIHDATVERTTDGRGPVAEMTLVELRRLDAGYRWSADGGRNFPYRGKGIRVPTLAEVLSQFTGRRMNLEIKPTGAAVSESVCRLVRASGKIASVLVASTQEDALEAFRKACPEVATSMDPGEGRRFYLAHLAHLAAVLSPRASALQAPFRIGDREPLSARLLADARARNLRVHAWTVNEEAAMRRLVALGIDGIITDRPDLLRRVLGRAR